MQTKKQATQELARVEREVAAGRVPFPERVAPSSIKLLLDQWGKSLKNRNADQHVASVQEHQPHRVVPEAKELAAGDSVEVARECLDEELPAGEGQQVPLVRLDQAEER